MAATKRIALPPPVVACPRCPKCGTKMALAYIFPHKLGQDQRTYECPRCEYEVTEIVKFDSQPSDAA
jgi:DNA-directed RNA polymerase subunit RPC12/RpoP